MGYTVVDATTVLSTHLTEIIKRNAHELLTREEVNDLLKNLKEQAPSLVEEIVPNVLKPGEVQRVLQNLLQEGVPIRDLATVLEIIGDYAPRTKDPEILTQYARNALARTITQMHLEKDGKMYVVTLDPRLEDMIRGATERGEHGSRLTLNPETVNRIVQRFGTEIERMITAGHEPVILCSPQVRVQVRNLAVMAHPAVAVLSYNEVLPDTRIEALGMISLEESVTAA
jgi:flagellar biosynthesis protein FlhA